MTKEEKTALRHSTIIDLKKFLPEFKYLKSFSTIYLVFFCEAVYFTFYDSFIFHLTTLFLGVVPAVFDEAVFVL